jgi:hypothetical protein
LGCWAAEVGEGGDLFGGGDALGGDVEALASADFDCGADEGGGLVGLEHVGGEFCGDFEVGGWDAQELGEGAVAGAEVVDGYAGAECA